MRRAVLLVVLALAIAPGRTLARGTFGEYLKVARAIEEWRYEDARAMLAELEKSAPDEPETRFWAAQLAFLDGDYARARNILEGIKDPSMKDLVRGLLPLVISTQEATAGFVSRESPGGHFVIWYQPGKDELIVDLAGEVLEAAWKTINEDLGYTPPGRVRVEILPRARDLARVSTLTEKDIETSGTIALCKYGKLMIVTPRATLFGYPWMDTLVHEYTHYVITRATNDRVPIWLHEGLAKFQESRWRAAPGAVGLGPTSEHLLATALKRGRLITFEEMHPSMAKLPSQEAAATAFAEVWSIVAWMHGKIGYPGIRTILGKIRDGRTERRAIAEVMGSPWDDVESAWRKHLRGLGLEPDPMLAGRHPPKRVRLKKSEGDEENVGLEQVEERARKYARLGGMLRARGRLAAAAIEYQKALAIVPGDPFVAAKLARTYLELGQPQRAIEVAGPLAERDEDDAGPQTTLGLAYLELGDHARAETHLDAALRVSPFDPSVRCGLGEVYTALGRSALAEREQNACRALRR